MSDRGMFGVLLRRYRAVANLTQEQLAERSGMSVQAIGALERGERRSPRPSTVEGLADALHLDSLHRERFVAAARGELERLDRESPAQDAGVAMQGAAIAMRTLPRDVANFSGREEETGRLLATVSETVRAGRAVAISAVDGMAGVGKTAFAVHVAHQLAGQFPDGQLFLDLHGHTPGQRPVEATDALASLLLTIGVAPQAIPTGLEDRAALWRARLAGRSVLIVLDDAAGHQQVQPMLPGTPGCLVLLTSRRRLAAPEDVETLTLSTLAPLSAVALFKRLSGVPLRATDSGAVHELVRLCGHLPLAIVLLAARLRAHPSWSVQYLVETLRNASDRLDELRVEHRGVEAAFRLSYEDLSPHLQRLFRRLGLHPGAEFDAFATGALADLPVAKARRDLESLYTDHLVEEPLPGRYRMHDLIRAYAQGLAQRHDREDSEAALDELVRYYMHAAIAANRHIEPLINAVPPPISPPPTPVGQRTTEVPDLSSLAAALTWMEAERTNLNVCVDLATGQGRYVCTGQIAHAMHSFLRIAGHWDQALAVHQSAVLAAQLGGDRFGQAAALIHAGRLESLMVRYEAAVKSSREALGIYRALDDRLGPAIALHDLGRAQCQLAESDAAASLSEALHRYRKAGHRLGQAYTLTDLGTLRRLAGEHPAAIDLLHESLAMALDLDDQVSRAHALGALGAVQRQMREYPAAAATLTESLGLFREVGCPVGQAGTLHELGVVQRETGEYLAAATSLSEALDGYRYLGSRLGQAVVLQDLSIAKDLAGDHPDAAAFRQEARHLLTDPSG